jgi:hypothetical protein
MLAPDDIDLVSGRRVAAVSIAAVGGACKHPRDPFDQGLC